MQAASVLPAAPSRLGAFLVVASTGLGVMVVALPNLSDQFALVLGTAASTATVMITRAGRSLNPAWVILAWLYLIGPIGYLFQIAGIGLSPALLVVLAPGPFALAALLSRPQSRDRLVLLAPLLLLSIFAGLSLAWSPSPTYGAEKLSTWVLTAVLPVAFILVLAPGSPGVFWKLIATAAFVSALGLILFGVAAPIYPGRPTLFDANPIWAARAAFVGALVVLFGPFPRIVKIGMSPVMIVAGLVTVSLGPFLGLLCGAWAGAVETLRSADRADRRVAIGWAVLSLGTVLIGAIVVIGAFLPETAALTSLLTDDPNVTGRAGYLGVAAPMFLQAPLAGIGIGGFAATGLTDTYPHNLVAEVAAELGVIGLLMLGSWFLLALRGAARSPILMALLVGTGVFSLFSGSLAGNAEFWLFSGLAVAMLPIGKARRWSGLAVRHD